jgi:hypothetical protein
MIFVRLILISTLFFGIFCVRIRSAERLQTHQKMEKSQPYLKTIYTMDKKSIGLKSGKE